MRFTARRFSVPICALAEPMPGKQFKLLIFLILISDYGGGCRPGYLAMMHAMRDHDGDKGSYSTTRSALTALQKRGWIFAMTRNNGKMVIWLQLPARFRTEKIPKNAISVIHS